MSPAPVTLRRIFTLWWPLAGSWMLMGLEMPVVTAVVARLPDEKVQLAAMGSVVYPVSILIEGPIIMLLAASTRMSSDTASWRRLLRFAHLAGFALSALHALIAFTPLFDVVVRDIIGVPEPVVEPARLGLRIMTPWSWMIAWRRFQQGALIRVERSRQIALGTLLRLVTNALVLVGGFLLAQRLGAGEVSGVMVGSTAIACGVIVEALYAEWGARRFVGPALARLPANSEPWSWRAFARFYLPLSCTPLIAIALQPAGAAAMSRLPQNLDSLAAWPAVYGLAFIFRSLGLAYSEVVVALLERPGAKRELQRFAVRLAILATLGLGVMAIPAVGELYYRRVSGLDPDLASFAVLALLVAVPMPFYSVWQNVYQGTLVHRRATRAVTEAVVIYALVAAVLLGLAVEFVELPGIRVVLGTFLIAGCLQTLWLRRAVLLGDRG